ncbi:MAG: DUF2961 domain-containing protein [Rikenellaceae bacterium]|nr:DUF2961 domain-containing protein [Rikenellaceae bacterium]
MLEQELRNLAAEGLRNLPAFRTGTSLTQFSSYDRNGMNDDGFAGTWSFARKEGDTFILAEWDGPGVLNRIWTPTPTSDTISIYFDGEETPRVHLPFDQLFSGDVFPFVKPLCGNEIGGFYCLTPMPFKKSCKITYTAPSMRFYQIQARSLPSADGVETFSMDWTPAQKKLLDETVGQLWNGGCAWYSAQLARQAAANSLMKKSSNQILSPGKTTVLFDQKKGGRIEGLELTFPDDISKLDRQLFLRAIWDKDTAIYCPLTELFGYAFGKKSVQSLMLGTKDSKHYLYMPMPYANSARIEVVYADGESSRPVEMSADIYYNGQALDPSKEGRLFTQWNREVNPKSVYRPYPIAELKGSGHYVGTVLNCQQLEPGMTLFFEGDDSLVVDGVLTAHGTGSEDYFNGGWYALLDRWDAGISLQLHGSTDYSIPWSRTGGYRFYMTDKIPFTKDLLLTIERGPERNESKVDYTSLAFFYTNDAANFHGVDMGALAIPKHVPTEFVFMPQITRYKIGDGTTVAYKGMLEMSSPWEGQMQVDFGDVPYGRYKLLISYDDTPESGMFCIWQRQKQITDWKSTYNAENRHHGREYIGDIEINENCNHITIHSGTRDGKNIFRFGNIHLVRIDQ